MAGINAAFGAHGREVVLPAETTAHGSLVAYLMNADPENFQPMNVNFGLFPPLAGISRRMRKREKYELLAGRALDALDDYVDRAAVLLE